VKNVKEIQLGNKVGRYITRNKIDVTGVVFRYKVYDEVENRTVEMTLFNLNTRPEQKESVDKILSTLEALSHSHLAEIISTGYYENRPYLVRRIVPGEMLRSRLGTTIASMEAAGMLAPAAGAVAYLHEKGVIHGCISPDSMVLNATRQAVIIDAGVGAVLSAFDLSCHVDQDDERWCYRAPDTDQEKIDYQADIFSLGAIYYEMLGGEKPFSDPAQKKSGPPNLRIAVRDIPWIAEQVALKALSPRPADRFSHMEQLASALEDLSHENQFAVRTQKWQKVMWFVIGAILLILLILVLTQVI
jgi:eukaryotic-like serine/threonine-protein kinase